MKKQGIPKRRRKLFSDGLFSGEFNNLNQMHGRGCFLTTKDSYFYFGEWNGGEMHGRGVVIYPFGGYSYGLFRNGQAEGITVLVLPNGQILRSISKKGSHSKKRQSQSPYSTALQRPQSRSLYQSSTQSTSNQHLGAAVSFSSSTNSILGESLLPVRCLVFPDEQSIYLGECTSPKDTRVSTKSTGINYNCLYNNLKNSNGFAASATTTRFSSENQSHEKDIHLLPNGIGVKIHLYANNMVSCGFFVQGQLDGKGRKHFMNGDRFHGMFQKGMFEGVGEYWINALSLQLSGQFHANSLVSVRETQKSREILFKNNQLIISNQQGNNSKQSILSSELAPSKVSAAIRFVSHVDLKDRNEVPEDYFAPLSFSMIDQALIELIKKNNQNLLQKQQAPDQNFSSIDSTPQLRPLLDPSHVDYILQSKYEQMEAKQSNKHSDEIQIQGEITLRQLFNNQSDQEYSNIPLSKRQTEYTALNKDINKYSCEQPQEQQLLLQKENQQQYKSNYQENRSIQQGYQLPNVILGNGGVNSDKEKRFPTAYCIPKLHLELCSNAQLLHFGGLTRSTTISNSEQPSDLFRSSSTKNISINPNDAKRKQIQFRQSQQQLPTKRYAFNRIGEVGMCSHESLFDSTIVSSAFVSAQIPPAFQSTNPSKNIIHSLNANCLSGGGTKILKQNNNSSTFAAIINKDESFNYLKQIDWKKCQTQNLQQQNQEQINHGQQYEPKLQLSTIN